MMYEKVKKAVGTLVIKLGEHSVGKCMIPGMYDPKIPQNLREKWKL